MLQPGAATALRRNRCTHTLKNALIAKFLLSTSLSTWMLLSRAFIRKVIFFSPVMCVSSGIFCSSSPVSRLSSAAVNAFSRAHAGKFIALMLEGRFDAVLVTHFFPAEVVSFLLEKKKIETRLITVLLILAFIRSGFYRTFTRMWLLLNSPRWSFERCVSF